MNTEGTYEAKLLRIVIGFLHVSLSQQLALTRHGKPFENLTPEDKDSLQTEMINSVMTVARQLSEEALQGFLKPPAPPGPPGQVH
jgi:hypothetical protein